MRCVGREACWSSGIALNSWSGGSRFESGWRNIFGTYISLGQEFTHICSGQLSLSSSVVDKSSTSVGWDYGGDDRLCRAAGILCNPIDMWIPVVVRCLAFNPCIAYKSISTFVANGGSFLTHSRYLCLYLRNGQTYSQNSKSMCCGSVLTTWRSAHYLPTMGLKIQYGRQSWKFVKQIRVHFKFNVATLLLHRLSFIYLDQNVPFRPINKKNSVVPHLYVRPNMQTTY